jgi:two-component system sensor histidine kinase HydH
MPGLFGARGGRRILGGRPAPRGELPVTTPPGFEEIQQQETGRLFGRMTAARLFLIPLFLGLFAWLVAIDRTPWRVALLAVALPAFVVFIVVEFRRYRAHGLLPGAIDLNLSFATGGVLLLVTASGGIDSPFLPVVFLVAMATALFASPRPGRVLFGVQLAGVWALAAEAALGLLPALHLSAFGPERGASRAWPVAVVSTVLLTVLRLASGAIRHALDATLARSVAAQRESLRVHGERAEELTALSAEIAHELKNPLASVKGLAALLARQPADEKDAERLGVLRREVDRMQATLDEFLNFSRPLVPLAMGPCDLSALAREVALLHEGLAHERGVAIAPPAGSVPARCDARKVRQVLMNLVQNAVAASPRDGTVEIAAAAAGGGGAVLTVLDRGHGVDPALGDAVFRPGVTTRAHGSGLGLTIARALARQHGGDLVLRPREGGGTVAEVTLPADPVAAEVP